MAAARGRRRLTLPPLPLLLLLLLLLLLRLLLGLTHPPRRFSRPRSWAAPCAARSRRTAGSRGA
jgi:hypothetical protein